MTWERPRGAYRFEYRASSVGPEDQARDEQQGPRAPDNETLFTGLWCDIAYDFMVRAQGNGHTYSSKWSDWTIKRATTPPYTPPSTPSFGDAVIADQRYQVDNSVNLLLPAATGGSGELTYSISPTMGNGLTFNSSTRTVKGESTFAADTVTYTYTVTDAKGETDQLSFTITAFNVRVRIDGKRLEKFEWSVLEYEQAIMRASRQRANRYQFRLQVPQNTGFQVNSTVCKWEATGSGLTEWMNGNATFGLVRCGLGTGDARVAVWVKDTETGASSKLYDTEPIPQAWHRHDHRVDYYVRGSGTNPNAQRANGVDVGSTEGMFPADRPSNLSQIRNPSEQLLLLENYKKVANAWTNVGAGVTIKPASSSANADVLVSGYWNPDPRGRWYLKDGKLVDRKTEPFQDGSCDGSVACVSTLSRYPHRDDTQAFSIETIFIEDPPQFGADNTSKIWTTDFNKAITRPDMYVYLLAVLTHEFGHSIALDHGEASGDIMNGSLRELPPCSYKGPQAQPCGLSSNEQSGAKAIYEGHTQD